jgi:hypothetical protein
LCLHSLFLNTIRLISQFLSAIVGFSSELVEISSEIVEFSSELVSTTLELLKISVFKITTTTDIVALAPSVYANRSRTFVFNNIKIVVNTESRKTMELQTGNMPNTLNAPQEQEKALWLSS